MLTAITNSKNENIQILQGEKSIAELIYPNISHYKANASYGENEIEFKLKLGLGSLVGMNKIDVYKNGGQVGVISFGLFGKPNSI